MNLHQVCVCLFALKILIFIAKKCLWVVFICLFVCVDCLSIYEKMCPGKIIFAKIAKWIVFILVNGRKKFTIGFIIIYKSHITLVIFNKIFIFVCVVWISLHFPRATCTRMRLIKWKKERKRSIFVREKNRRKKRR